MAKAAALLPTEAELAKARLLIARSDQVKKKSKKSKGKDTSVDQENKDPSGEDQAKKKKAAIAVSYVI
jgi:hypothetical protein